VINGWPDLLIDASVAKVRLDVLSAEARRIQGLPVDSEVDLLEGISAILAWRETAYKTFLELFEPSAAIRFQSAIAANILAPFKRTVERFASAQAMLAEDVTQVFVLAVWIESTGAKPMAVSPSEMIAQLKANRKSQLSQTPPAPPPAPQLSQGIDAVGWSRRLTAFAIHILFWADIFRLWDFDIVRKALLHPIPHSGGMSYDTVVSILATAWVLYLTQFKPRWAFLLPLYLVASPPILILKWLGGAVVGPLYRAVQKIFNPSSVNPGEALERSRRRRIQWTLWVVLWIIWFVALRDIRASWIFWVPVLLTLPLWCYGIKWSLSSAVAPPSLTLLAVNFCSRHLDEALRAWPGKPEKERKTAANVLAFWAMGGSAVSRRYTGRAKLITIQQEAIVVFSVVLLSAFGLSCVWFGLLAQAILHTWPTSLSGYSFFGSGSLIDTTLWALGCMTTAVSFPTGGSTPMAIKMLHGFMLITGIFQVTYLLACFSIVSATDSTRVSDSATVSVTELDAKVSMALAIKESFELQAKGRT